MFKIRFHISDDVMWDIIVYQTLQISLWLLNSFESICRKIVWVFLPPILSIGTERSVNIMGKTKVNKHQHSIQCLVTQFKQ